MLSKHDESTKVPLGTLWSTSSDHGDTHQGVEIQKETSTKMLHRDHFVCCRPQSVTLCLGHIHSGYVICVPSGNNSLYTQSYCRLHDDIFSSNIRKESFKRHSWDVFKPNIVIFFRLDVAVEGEPLPKVTWYKNDVVLAPRERIVIIQDRNVSTLTINKVRPEDVAEYVCVAENDRGVVTCKTTLHVTRK